MKVKSTSSLEVNFTISLTETEARALKAITEYGSKSFLEVFYEKLGRLGLEPYENGIIDLFNTIRNELPEHLKKADNARDIWNESKEEQQ